MRNGDEEARGPIAVPVLSVVLCTHNRSALLRDALQALAAQDADTGSFEVIVVDNASTDETPSVVADFASHRFFRYRREPVLGLSTARNHGIRHARGSLVAFTDDDTRPDPSWVRTIIDCFAQHPDIEYIGGKVLPLWEQRPPSWLAATGVAPLALADYGDAPFVVDDTRRICLIGANLCVRRRAFEQFGLFSTRVQRLGDGIGSTEDQEFEVRLMQAGARGLYVPSMIVRAVVPPHRLERAYHRTWHAGHGRFYARMREPQFEASRGAFLGVPAHVFAAGARELAAWVQELLRLRDAEAFAHELRLRFLVAFARERIFGRP